MNIWDSVQRGLEKATHEAGRIAKGQRLRATIESLSKQIETQQSAILRTAMDLFNNGQLTQNELLVLCQALHNSQQQLTQAQSELKLIQNQSNPGTQVAQTAAYTQSSHQPYDNTLPALVPPPPPGFEPLNVSSLETMRMPPSANEQAQCNRCQASLIPGNAFCHNCGAPVQNDTASYQPTVRGTIGEGVEARQGENTVFDVAEQATRRAEEPGQIIQDTPHDGGN